MSGGRRPCRPFLILCSSFEYAWVSQPTTIEIPPSPLCKGGLGGFAPFTLVSPATRGIVTLKAKWYNRILPDVL